MQEDRVAKPPPEEGPHDYAERICRAAERAILKAAAARGISMTILAERAQIGRASLYRLLNEKGYLTLHMLARRSRASELRVFDIFLKIEIDDADPVGKESDPPAWNR